MKRESDNRSPESQQVGSKSPPLYDVSILERSAAFADRIVRLTLALPQNVAGWELGRQLVRCGTSVGANIEEAQGAESTADFLHKMRIARKECRESRYFLRRIGNAELLPPNRLDQIVDETSQLLNIITAIIRNTDRNHSKRTKGETTSLGPNSRSRTS